MTLPRPRREAILLGLVIVLAALLVAACAGANVVPASSGGSPATASPHPPLVPASPGIDPFSLLAWALNPVFQILFIGLVWLQKLTGDIGIAIIILTLVIRAALIPLFRRQIVSMKRTQLIQPELKELQRRYKGDRNKLSQAQMELYKERGVSPASGCLPLLLQLPLLMIIYSVISQGLTNPDPHAMFSLFGIPLVTYDCVNGLGTPDYNPYMPCIDTTVTWLGNMDVSKPWVLFPESQFLGWFSLLAAISAVLQLIQSRMTMPPATGEYNDQSSKLQRQLVMFLPLLSLVYGSFLPAGLFIYWIVTTIFGIVQQYLIVGMGIDVPVPALGPGLCQDPPPALPRRDAHPEQLAAWPGARRGEAVHHAHRAHRGPACKVRRRHGSPPRERPPGPPREKALTMTAYQEFTGKSVEEALRSAREEFGVGLDELDFEILTPGSRGVLGMGAEPARIVAAPRSALGGADAKARGGGVPAAAGRPAVRSRAARRPGRSGTRPRRPRPSPGRPAPGVRRAAAPRRPPRSRRPAASRRPRPAGPAAPR